MIHLLAKISKYGPYYDSAIIVGGGVIIITVSDFGVDY